MAFPPTESRTPPAPDAVSTQTVIVVGNGMVGFRFCEQLSERDTEHRYRLVVFGEESRPAYDRVHLSTAFYGADPDRLSLAGPEWYAARGIELHLSDPVVAIDRSQRTVRAASGLEKHYDYLVLATGAAPLLPPIEGTDLPGVFVYRSVDDLRRIRTYATSCERVAVIGGGLLGLEAAKALHDLGLETHVVEFAASLLVRQLNLVAAGHLRARLEELGLRVHLGKDTRAIEARGEGGKQRVLCFADGSSLDTDMVLVAIGVRPRDALAAACGLPCGIKGGVKVDERLQTEDPRVHAIGECALQGGVFYGFVAPGYRMAEVLASNLLGADRACSALDTSTRLKIEGLEVNIVGDPWGAGESLSHAMNGDYRQLVVKKGRIQGMTVVGAWPELGRLKELRRSARRLSRFRLTRFRRTGRIWSQRSERDVLRWPAGAVICECMGVTLGELQDARSRGGASVEALRSVTGASTVCGSCRHLLAKIAGERAAVPLRRERALLAASVLAVAACVTTVVAAPVPLAETVRARALDALWRESVWKQASGYALAFACASSLVLSLRKRWRRLQRGEYSSWRALHAGIGASTLALLFAHTGFRLGENFNQAVMGTFLALAVLGGCAGAVTALEGRCSPPITPGLRVLVTRLHLLFFWPLVVLVVFHVLTVYLF